MSPQRSASAQVPLHATGRGEDGPDWSFPERVETAARSPLADVEGFVTDTQKERDDERGKRASFDPDSGEVHGSGSGAGGGGNPREDYDSDPMAGSGVPHEGGPRPEDRAEERPIDKDEGI